MTMGEVMRNACFGRFVREFPPEENEPLESTLERFYHWLHKMHFVRDGYYMQQLCSAEDANRDK